VKAFVTGITGFAGTHLAEHLLNCGDEVLGCSRSGAWKREAPAQLTTGVKLLAWDVAAAASPEVVGQLQRFRPDVIYHLAAISVPDACGTDEPNDQALAVNVEGTRHVLALAGTLPSLPRVLLVSTRHVYGRAESATPVAEDAPLCPHTAYGLTKLAAEELARGVRLQACPNSQQPSTQNRARLEAYPTVVIARAFTHAGPRQPPSLLPAQWCEQLVRPVTPLVVHNPRATIDLSDVRDVVRAYRLLAMHGENGQAYNVGTGVARTCGEILQLLLSIAAPRYPVKALAESPHFNAVADTRKLRLLTGWWPEIPLETTLADTWRFWLERARTSS
jgi:GDP-4-dehydro-6-deoxy-D-mannose reductase